MPITNVSTTALPTDYGIQAQEIERRRKLAEAMQAQSMQPLATNETAGGYVLPVSKTAGLAKMLQAYAGNEGQRKATEQQMQLAAAMRGDRQQTIQEAMAAMQGTPATQGSASPTDELGGGPAQPPQAAVPGDAGRGYSILAGSQDPALSQYGATAGFEEATRKRKLAEMMGAFGLNPGAAGGGAQSGPTSAPGTTVAASKDDIGGVPRQIAMALLITDPSGKSLAAAQAKAAASASTPMNVRPGGTVYVPGQGPQFTAPNGAMQTTWQGGQPQVGTVPGALPAMGAQAQAQAAGTQAGQAPYQPSVVQTEGAPTLMTREQQIQAATGKPMPQAGMPQQAPQMAPQPPPQTQGIVQPPVPGGYSGLQQANAAARAQGLNLQSRENLQTGNGLPSPAAVLGQPQTPGLRLQDQGAGAQQKSFGTERGQLEAAKPQAAIQGRTILASIDRLNSVANELENHPGLKDITGKIDQYSALDVMPQTRAARALQGSLVKQAAVNTLQSMRDASKTGGAVGAVTEKEWPILEQQLAALDGAQSPKDYKVALQNLQNQMKGAMGRIKSAYSETYGSALDYEPIPYARQGRATDQNSRNPPSDRRQEPRESGGRIVVNF